MKKNKGLSIKSTKLVFYKRKNLPVLQTSDIIFAFDGLLKTFFRSKIFGLHNEKEQWISNQGLAIRSFKLVFYEKKNLPVL